MKSKRSPRQKTNNTTGKLKIGDNWSAISIIALSQNNPLKAIAEFVENSIDARAKNITIVRGKERGDQYLKIIDDGEGVPKNEEGIPNFAYVATHICDSIKKRLKKNGMQGIQGEFGIGLLSFWTVGERLSMSSAGTDGSLYRMEMTRDEQGYSITSKKMLLPDEGTELVIHPLLPGLRQLSGEKIQNYLASELRDRIRTSGVIITIKDRYSRKELVVEPRQFEGLLIHDIPLIETPFGEIYPEIYLNAYNQENTIALHRLGTRVFPDITKIDEFNEHPWNSGYLQGMIDVGFLNLTPGTRDGVIRDDRYFHFINALAAIESMLSEIIEQEKKAEEEKASKDILKSVQKALKEAFLALPAEEYAWLDLYGGKGTKQGKQPESSDTVQSELPPDNDAVIMKEKNLELGLTEEKKFYEYAGPLYSVIVTPSSSIIKTRENKNLRIIARDKNRRLVENAIETSWSIKEGAGTLTKTAGEMTTFEAAEEPGITVITAVVTQHNIQCTAESIITVTEELIKKDADSQTGSSMGLPSYTFKHSPGELWRSRYDKSTNVIIINNGHADYHFAAKKNTRKLKYITKLYTKELILHNFAGYTKEEILERMVELELYTEENLK
ncbi:MAG: ATP-binding protein [Spirochaetales bacterium]|nr:ATP-binding protein [Spirochaetales bacterium]